MQRLQNRLQWKFRPTLIDCKLFKILVGAGRFERPTPCAQGRCATRLRYAPTYCGLFILKHFLARRTPTRSKTGQSERDERKIHFRPSGRVRCKTMVP